MGTYLFLDTNIYLHFKQFDQIDWKKLLGLEDFTIVLPSTVISELDNHKTNKIERISKQAKKIIKLLELYSNEQTSPKLIKVLFIPFEQNSSIFSSHMLDSGQPDDKIIASILKFKENHTENIILVSYDLGIKLKAKQYKISTYEPPESLLLEIDDSLEKKNKELMKEITQIKNKAPILKILFDNKKTYKRFILKEYKVDQSLIQRELDKLKLNFPFKSSQSSYFNEKNNILVNNNVLDFMNKESVSRYNNSLLDYYDDYRRFLEKENDYDEMVYKSCMVKLLILNEGTIPADDIHISFHIPDGVEIYDKYQFPQKPTKPVSPTYMSTFEILNGKHNYLDMMNRISLPKNNISVSNVSGLKINRSNSFDINTRVKRLMHQKHENLEVFFITYSDIQSAFSFEFEYSIIAENIPQEINGKLNILIDRT